LLSVGTMEWTLTATWLACELLALAFDAQASRAGRSGVTDRLLALCDASPFHLASRPLDVLFSSIYAQRCLPFQVISYPYLWPAA
jgi:hypothetical protein